MNARDAGLTPSAIPFLTLAQARLKKPAPPSGPTVPSPCVGVCRMTASPAHPEPLCAGCLRTVPEISAWSRASDPDKLTVWAELERRFERHRPTGIRPPE